MLSFVIVLQYINPTFYLSFQNVDYIGAEGFTPEQDVEEVRQIEKQVKRRFAIGTQVSYKKSF